ncbi:MAG: sensor histidine kinase, partial [Stellaceae bacterium]
PARFAAPVRPLVAEAAPAAPQPRWRDTVVTAALALAALVPPIVLLARPEMLSLIGRLIAAVPLIGALVVAPGAVGGVAALRGLAWIRDGFRSRADSEPEHAVARIFMQAGLLAYAVGLAAAGDAASAAPCLVVGVLGLVSGWLILLHVVLSPAPSAIRRHAAIIIDVGLFSAFLHFGADAAAALYPLYLVTIFYAGLRLGFGALITAAFAAIAGFAAVVATTPFWQQQPALAGGLGVALAALPAGMTLLVRALARSRGEAVAANAARERFVAVIGRGLRAPVEAMRLALPEAVADGEAPARPAEPGFALPARALLSQISEVVDLAAIESGDFTPPTEPFDLHALVNDTLAPLRVATAQRGISLTLRIDPAVPY